VRALAVAVLLLCVAAVPADAASAPRLPSRDPFYRYTGAKPLDDIRPGTILKRRSVRLALGPGHSTPVRAEQLLYRTTGQRGEATVTVTTVLRPPNATAAPRIVAYLSFYDGLGPQCDPSYTLAGGDAGDSTYQQEAMQEELLILWYLSQGSIVTVPDFEGTGLHWMAGRESGYGTLDAIRATESYLRVGRSTKVGLSGYSGGAVAANWASELAPTYAPSLDIVGVAMGGVPANYFHHLAYMSGTDEYSAAVPGELLGLSRAYGIDLTNYVSPRGRQIVEEVSNVCIASVFGDYPGLTIDDPMRPEYTDLAHAEPFATMLREQTMGMAPRRPRGPMLIAIGNVDGTGDGAMVAADAKNLARRYCHKGVDVEYQEYPGVPHPAAGAFFDPQTGPFLQARFAGLPFASNCSSLG
jgi:hypothetical protein